MPTRQKPAALALALVAAQPLAAQDVFIPGTSPMDLMPQSQALTSSVIGNLSVGGTAGAGRRGNAAGASIPQSGLGAARALFNAAATGDGSPVATAALSYLPDRAVRDRVFADFVARVRRTNKAAAAAMVAGARRQSFFSAYSLLMRSTGYQANNVADALAGFVVFGWMVCQGRELDVNDEGQRLVRSRVATLLARDPRMKSARFRQQVGDELQILTVLMTGGFKSAVQEQNVGTYAAGVAEMMRGVTGQDLRRWRLTQAGFVR